MAAGSCLLALRFTDDALSPGERFRPLRAELGEAFMAVQIDSSRDDPDGISRLVHPG